MKTTGLIVRKRFNWWIIALSTFACLNFYRWGAAGEYDSAIVGLLCLISTIIEGRE